MVKKRSAGDDLHHRRDGTMVGDFDVKPEADELDDGDEVDDFREEAYDDRTGEVLDAKLATNAESAKIWHTWSSWRLVSSRPKTNAGPKQEEPPSAPSGFA